VRHLTSVRMYRYLLATLEALVEAPNDFETMAEVCIINHEEIVRHGSPEMQAALRALLYALAAEIERREQAMSAANDDQA
jgi:hypothetical protein